MLVDPRMRKLAYNLVNYSCSVRRGENVWIEAYGVDAAFVNCLVEEVYAAGGYPYVSLYDNRVQRAVMKGMDETLADRMRAFDAPKMDAMQCYIGVRGGENPYETSDIPADRTAAYSKFYSLPVHHDRRVAKTKWVILRWPTQGMSSMSGMSTENFEDFFFKVCNLDYRRMDEAMTPLVELMNATDRVRLSAPGTDLEFSIKDIPAVKCCGLRNIPDGEVYTAPVRDSVNGRITYNIPSPHDGIRFENISLLFKDGKIIDASANDTAAINKIFDTDEGARYVGEFSLGVNPFITRAMGDILSDEKIRGSLHFTPGSCYDEAFNGNRSAIHWDLVLDMSADKGGGEIYFDGRLIRKDGVFVVKELEGLNPENLGRE